MDEKGKRQKGGSLTFYPEELITVVSSDREQEVGMTTTHTTQAG